MTPADPDLSTARPDSRSTSGVRAPELINVAWGEALVAGDVEAMLALYEADAVMVPGPGREPVSGHAAIEASLRWLVSLGGTITHQPRFWIRAGDLAVGRIDFQLAGADPSGAPVQLDGATVELARRQPDGTWKYVVDHPFGAG